MVTGSICPMEVRQQISPGHILKSISRWIVLTLISWGTQLMTSVQHWSSDANWMKMWVNTFPSHSRISLHFTRQNTAYRVASVSINACDSVRAFKAHYVLSRERLPQTWDSTDTVRPAPMLRKYSISAGLANVLGLVSNIICFHFV